MSSVMTISNGIAPTLPNLSSTVSVTEKTTLIRFALGSSLSDELAQLRFVFTKLFAESQQAKLEEASTVQGELVHFMHFVNFITVF